MRSAVLAGGASTRFGSRPKGLVDFGGRTLLDRAVDTLTQACGRPPLLIANDPGAAAWRPDLETVADTLPYRASLSGLYTAVSFDPSPVLVLAWDMPFVTAPLLRALIRDRGEYESFIPESTGPRGLEPLCGVYAPTCADAIRTCLTAGRLEANAFYSDVSVGTLSLQTVRRFGEPEQLFLNVNTPDDLTRAERILAVQSSGRS